MSEISIVGFTGSRFGMTPEQNRTFCNKLELMGHGVIGEYEILADMEFHHGDCRGADEEAHLVASSICRKVVVHPPENPKHRAFCRRLPFRGGAMVQVLDSKPYMDRNRDIVDAVDVLFAAPSGPERLRSGTWATVRYARKRDVEVRILPWECHERA